MSRASQPQATKGGLPWLQQRIPLSLLSWQDAVHAVFSERVSVVAEYDAWARSPSTRIRLPSVVALRKYQRAARRVAFTVVD